MIKDIRPESRKLMEKAWKDYTDKLKAIKAAEVTNILTAALADRMRKVFTGSVSFRPDASEPWVFVYLAGDDNIEKTWNLFLDNNIELLELIGGSTEYKTEIDDYSVQITWPRLTVCLYYTGGACERVITGTVLEEKHTYAIKCK